MVSSYAEGLKIGRQCNAVSVDKKCYKVCRKEWWVYTAISKEQTRHCNPICKATVGI